MSKNLPCITFGYSFTLQIHHPTGRKLSLNNNNYESNTDNDNKKIFTVLSDLMHKQFNPLMGFQDMLPQSVVSWHIEYFKLKEFEKTAEARGHSDFPTSSLLKQVIKPSCGRYPPCTWRKEASLSLKTKEHQRRILTNKTC